MRLCAGYGRFAPPDRAAAWRRGFGRSGKGMRNRSPRECGLDGIVMPAKRANRVFALGCRASRPSTRLQNEQKQRCGWRGTGGASGAVLQTVWPGHSEAV